MALFNFASLAHPSKYGYAFDTSAYSSSCETHYYFRQFETYGDGLIQHSGDWGVTFEYLADYCASLAEAMLSNPDLVKAAGYAFRSNVDSDTLEFAASVVYDEKRDAWHSSKRRYVSMALRKIGGESKRHDKRFEEVNRYMDGSCASMMRLICGEYTLGFDRYLYSLAVESWASRQKKHPGFGEVWHTYFNGDWTKNNTLRRSVDACRSLVEAMDKRAAAEDWLSGYKGGLERERVAMAPAESAASVIESGAEDSPVLAN